MKVRTVLSNAIRKLSLDILSLAVILTECGAMYYHVSRGGDGHRGQPFYMPGGFEGELLTASVWVSTLLVIPTVLSAFWMMTRLRELKNQRKRSATGGGLHAPN